MLPGPLLSVPEEYLLPFPFTRKRVIVRVKEHDRSLSCLAFGKRFPHGLIDGSLFHLDVTVSFPRRVIMDKVKWMYCCVTSVDFICSVPLSRIVTK